MRRIINRKVELYDFNTKGLLICKRCAQQINGSYFDFIIACVNHVGQGGILSEEQAKRLRIICPILEAQTKNIKHVDLEDADMKTLQNLVKFMPWNIISKELVEFTKYITDNADSVEFKEIEKAAEEKLGEEGG